MQLSCNDEQWDERATLTHKTASPAVPHRHSLPQMTSTKKSRSHTRHRTGHGYYTDTRRSVNPPPPWASTAIFGFAPSPPPIRLPDSAPLYPQAILDEKLGLSPQILARTSFMFQHDTGGLLAASDAELKQELSLLVPLTEYHEAATLARRRGRDLQDHARSCEAQALLRVQDAKASEQRVRDAQPQVAHAEARVHDAQRYIAELEQQVPIVCGAELCPLPCVRDFAHCAPLLCVVRCSLGLSSLLLSAVVWCAEGEGGSCACPGCGALVALPSRHAPAFGLRAAALRAGPAAPSTARTAHGLPTVVTITGGGSVPDSVVVGLVAAPLNGVLQAIVWCGVWCVVCGVFGGVWLSVVVCGVW